MAIFMVGYDLHEGQNYKNLEDAIKALGSWWHCLDSTWLVESDQTALVIRDLLRPHIKSDDCLLVMRYGNTHSGFGANAAWYGFTENRPSTCQDWLKSNL